MSIYIDIHRHSANKDKADIVLRNLFHKQTNELPETLFASVGLHPWHVSKAKLSDDLKKIESIVSDTNVLAIGETGLDKAISTELSTQEDAFLAQLELAIENQKPLVIHCVKAYNELQYIRSKTKHKNPWIFHWFNASFQTGIDLIRKGCYLSFGHMLFNETSKAFKSFTQFPLDRIFFETDDAGYSIEDIYRKASELLKVDMEHLKDQIQTNFETCFSIKL